MRQCQSVSFDTKDLQSMSTHKYSFKRQLFKLTVKSQADMKKKATGETHMAAARIKYHQPTDPAAQRP